jgi:hypothetical protein
MRKVKNTNVNDYTLMRKVKNTNVNVYRCYCPFYMSAMNKQAAYVFTRVV